MGIKRSSSSLPASWAALFFATSKLDNKSMYTLRHSKGMGECIPNGKYEHMTESFKANQLSLIA
jgi:hypothetical protein